MSLPKGQPASEPSDNRPFAGKRANRLMTARELMDFTEEKVKGIVTDKDIAHIPWGSNLSDHLMQSYFDGKDIRIATWNVLNPKYIRHLAPSEDPDAPGVDMSQRLHNMPFASVGYAAHRLPLIAAIVVDMVAAGYIMCLQEVAPELVESIAAVVAARNVASPDAKPLVLSEVKTDESTDHTNCNLTMWDTARYMQEAIHMFNAPKCGAKSGLVTAVTLKTTESRRSFDIINVHVAFGKNEEYARTLMNTYVNRPAPVTAFVAGDFNVSCRFAPLGNVNTDYIVTCYDLTEQFLFAVENEEPYFSHVNTYENTLDCRLQLDKFDHILAINIELLAKD
jgi:Endonuclease/Exonuclease/phosphatase family